jgi:hypothetical protein
MNREYVSEIKINLWGNNFKGQIKVNNCSEEHAQKTFTVRTKPKPRYKLKQRQRIMPVSSFSLSLRNRPTFF